MLILTLMLAFLSLSNVGDVVLQSSLFLVNE